MSPTAWEFEPTLCVTRNKDLASVMGCGQNQVCAGRQKRLPCSALADISYLIYRKREEGHLCQIFLSPFHFHRKAYRH